MSNLASPIMASTQTADLDWDHSVGEHLQTDDEFSEEVEGPAFYNG